MFKSICSKIKKVALAGLAVLGLTSTAMAAEETSGVSLTLPDLGWSSMASDILSYITTGILAALGIGLAIFGIRVVYRMFKGFAK